MICDLLFQADTIAKPDFDPSEPIAFWDLTNQQDWHVCELQQRGTSSRSWVAGRYSNNEASVHAFDQMLGRSLRGRRRSRATRTVRERYDTPPPKVRGPVITHTDGADADGPITPRRTATRPAPRPPAAAEAGQPSVRLPRRLDGLPATTR